MDKYFGGVIWTDHALKRLSSRGIKQGDAWSTWRRPDHSRYATIRGAWIYDRSFGKDTIEVVAKKRDKQWIILSVWSRGVTEQSRPSLLFASLWKKLLRLLSSE